MPKMRAIPQLVSAPLNPILANCRTFEREEHSHATEHSYWQAILTLPQI